MPAGYAPIVVDNGSTDGSGAIAARARRAGRRTSRAPGFGAACFAGLRAARADVVCFMDCDGSLDPRELPRVAEPGRGGRGRPRARRPRAPAAAPGRCTRALANRVLALELRRRTGVAAARPRADARGAPRGAARPRHRDRRFGWPLEMVLRAAARGLADRRGPVAYRAARGPLEGDRHGARDARARSATWRAVLARRERATLIVIAKAPVPGRVKTRLCPPCTPEQAAALGRGGAGATRSRPWPPPARPARARARRRARAVAAGRVRGGRAARRRARRAARARVRATSAARRFLVGMDTPQVTAGAARRRARGACAARDAVLGPAPTAATGASGCAGPTRPSSPACR